VTTGTPEPREHDADDVVVPQDAPVGPVLNFQTPQLGARGLLRSGAIVSVVALLTNGFNVVFHFVLARFMGPSEYSLLTTMFAVFLIASVPLIAIQSTVARDMATLMGRGDERDASIVLRSSLRTVFRAGTITVVVAMILFYPMIAILHVDRPLPILAVVVAFLVQIPGPLVSGALQASERFWVLSWTQAMQSGLKLGAGVALAALGFGASAVMFGFAGATMASLVVMLFVVRPILDLSRGEHVPASRIIGGYAIGAALTLGCNTVLTNADLLWARAGLTPHEAGLYAAVSVATGVILLIPIGLNTVLFVRVARLAPTDGARQHLLLGLVTVAAIATPCVIALAVIPVPLLHLGFGSAYDDAAPWLWPLGLSMAFYALAVVYLNHLLALGRSSIALVMVSVIALQELLLLQFHHSGMQIVGVQIACSIVLLLACEGFLVVTNRRSRNTGLERQALGETT